ncbi:nucleoside hydrolase [Nonomuraea sp. NPDC026600]|uniref:nucleoside hydrolase n=1 Tax=Nonomuraea sp. NPDC026600 TaxID=3155363 RepID=UPI0033E6AFAC
MSQSFVIDTDTASDDAVALLLAARDPRSRIRAVTVVAGNVPLVQGVRNAKVTLELAGAADVPVWAGCGAPLVRDLGTAQNVHGSDGMSGTSLPEPRMATQDGHAVLALLAIARDEPGQHTLVTLGPLTNIAAAVTIDPGFLTRFRHTYMMLGTSDGNGNVSAIAEYNAWADPEAAQVVLRAPGEKTMVGWDISRKYAVIDPAEDRRLRDLGRLGSFAADINRDVHAFAVEETGLAGYDLPDPIAMAIAIDPGMIVSAEDLHLQVSTDPVTRGHTYADRRTPPRPVNTRVVTSADGQVFLDALRAAVTL